MRNIIRNAVIFVVFLPSLFSIYGKDIQIGFGGAGEYSMWSGKNIFSLYPVISLHYAQIEWQTRIGESITKFSPIFGMPRFRTGITGNFGNPIYISGGINEELMNYFGEWEYYPIFSIGVGFHNKNIHYSVNIVKSLKLENYLGFECAILYFPFDKKERK